MSEIQNLYIQNLEKRAEARSVAILGESSPSFMVGYIATEVEYLLERLQLTAAQRQVLESYIV